MTTSVGALGALLHAEYLKISSTRTWWALMVPVALLGLLTGLFAGLFTLAVGVDADEADALPFLLAALAYTLTLTAVFAAVHGAVAAAGEFRHRTVTTTYLTAPGRGTPLLAKLLAAGAVGGLYAVAALVGVLLGGLLSRLMSEEAGVLPGPGPLLAVWSAGLVVAVLWGAIGAALGTLVANQAGALVTLLIYVLLGEVLLGFLLEAADRPALSALGAWLPVNAGEVAVYHPAATALVGSGVEDIVGLLAGVAEPLSPSASLLVLLGWTALAGVGAWWVAGRRDIT